MQKILQRSEESKKKNTKINSALSKKSCCQMQTILQTKEKSRKKREKREKSKKRKKAANSERWRHHLHYCGHRLKLWRLVDNHARAPTDQLMNFSTIQAQTRYMNRPRKPMYFGDHGNTILRTVPFSCRILPLLVVKIKIKKSTNSVVG